MNSNGTAEHSERGAAAGARSPVRLRDLAAALALANLLFFYTWGRLIPALMDQQLLIYQPGPPPRALFLLVPLCVLGFALLLWLPVFFARRHGSARLLLVSRVAFVVVVLLLVRACVLMVAPTVTAFLEGLAPGPRVAALAAAAVVVGALLFLALRRRDGRRPLARLFGFARGLVLVTAPFVLVTFAQALWTWADHESLARSFADRPTAEALPPRASAGWRVVWVTFDEFDYDLCFESRPDSLSLPEFDRLLGEAVTAERAYPPGGSTRLTTPGFLVGQRVEGIHLPAPDTVLLALADREGRVDLGDLPTLFSKTRALGSNAGVAAYYFPYGRLCAGDLVRCSWCVRPPPPSLGSVLEKQVDALFRAVPVVGRRAAPFARQAAVASRRSAIAEHRRIVEQASSMVGDPTLDLVFVWFKVPHMPPIYDAAGQRFDDRSPRTYFDNVALADRALGELRTRLESAGLDDRTVLVVTSDHWVRAFLLRDHASVFQISETDRAFLLAKEDRRVPFLLRMPGQSTTVRYPEAFNTVLLHALVLDLLRDRDLQTASDVVAWLDRMRGTAKVEPVLEAR